MHNNGINRLPIEKIIAYNIGVFESVQKFGGLITSGKITSSTEVEKIAELLQDSFVFYDVEMIASLLNAMLYHTKNSTIEKVTRSEVTYVVCQLKVSCISPP